MTYRHSHDSVQPDFPAKYHGYVGIFLTLGFFQMVNVVVVRAGPPKRLKGDFFRWKNLMVSWIHALIVGTWDLVCFWLYPEMTEDLLDYNNWFIYALVVFSTGYFIYDFLDIACAGQLFSSWEVILHHIAVLATFIYGVVTYKYIAYKVVALLTEVNAVFLHGRKLMQLKQVDYSGLPYRLMCIANLITFVPFRFVPVTVISYAIFFHYDRFSMLYYILLSICVFFMFAIYCVLFWRLVKSDVLRAWSTKDKKRHQSKINNNENLYLNSSTLGNNDCHDEADKKSKAE